MKFTPKEVIGEIVAHDYRTAKVFQKYDIDFCCSGNRNLEQATAEKNLDVDVVIQELEAILKEKGGEHIDYKSWPLDLLADYIEKTIHRKTEEQIPTLQAYLAKINRVHGSRHPELGEIEALFDDVAKEMAGHMKKEELMVFPLIRMMAAGKDLGGRSVSAPINAMMAEHDDQGDHFRRIASLSDNYTPPADACNTYRVAFGLLSEFEQDLHRHIHIENNILFPASIQLEEQAVV